MVFPNVFGPLPLCVGLILTGARFKRDAFIETAGGLSTVSLERATWVQVIQTVLAAIILALLVLAVRLRVKR